MSEPAGTPKAAGSITPETLVAVKVALQDTNKRIFLKVKDLGPHKFPTALRTTLGIPAGKEFVIERYSDSAGAYTALDPHNNQAYKTLYRAAKAKLKLRLRVTELPESSQLSTKGQTQVVKQEEATPTTPCTLSVKTEQSAPEVEQPSTFGCQASKQPQNTSGEDTADVKLKSNQSGEEQSSNEAPVPEPFATSADCNSPIITYPQAFRPLSLQSKDTTLCSWSVYCNACGKSMPDAHFHCNICEDSDYDLCESCVEGGQHCPGQGHWLIKRNVINGNFISSVTEKVPPKAKEDIERDIPGAFNTEDEKSDEKTEAESAPQRACNSCIELFAEEECITCTTCEDFDLCVRCQIENKHGHHPAHTFVPVKPSTATPLIELLCSPNRGVSHAAFCDGCDKKIVGVRHKCLTCPDWDYCSGCFKSAEFIHPRHRFAPVYEPLPLPPSRAIRHLGIYCDGPLCKDKERQTYIQGVRYKCVICNDTDFCANCEASPNNKHNKTHPLMKFRSPVRNVSVMTSGEDRRGISMPQMGDIRARRSGTRQSVIETLAPSVNVATQVQGEINAKKNESLTPKAVKERIEIKNLLAEPNEEKVKEPELVASKDGSAKSVPPKVETATPSTGELKAHYATDVVADGTRMAPGVVFRQVWTLFNPGPHPWPIGCSVKYVGGDNTLNIDTDQPSSAEQIEDATESPATDSIVPKGGLAAFRVYMRAPQEEGRAISYWRVKAPDGTPFGHRLWCDITVVNSERLSPGKENNLAMDSPRITRPLPILTADKPANGNDEASLTEIETGLASRRAMFRDLEKMLTHRTSEAEDMPVMPCEQKPMASSDRPTQLVNQDTCSTAVESSKMIFPQLERESPASSVHKITTTAGIDADVNPDDGTRVSVSEPLISSNPRSAKEASDASTAAGTVGSTEQDLFEDAESLRLEDSDGETFLTDEEYDILDASDEEFS